MRGAPLLLTTRAPLQHAVTLLAHAIEVDCDVLAEDFERPCVEQVARGLRKFAVDEIVRALDEEEALLPLTCRVERILRRRGVAAGGAA